MPFEAEGAHGSFDSGGTSKTPTPDPTVLTTEQLLRAISSERDYTNGQLEVLRERLAGIDTATELRLRGIEHIPQQIDEKVARLEAVMQEKFLSISKQFQERDTRSERESRDNKVAVDAAFAAQKEAASEQNKSNTLAIDKSERATAETLNKQADLFKSTTDALAANQSDLKTRVERLESIKQGGQQAYAGIYALAGFIVLVLAIIGGIAAMQR